MGGGGGGDYLAPDDGNSTVCLCLHTKPPYNFIETPIKLNRKNLTLLEIARNRLTQGCKDF